RGSGLLTGRPRCFVTLHDPRALTTARGPLHHPSWPHPTAHGHHSEPTRIRLRGQTEARSSVRARSFAGWRAGMSTVTVARTRKSARPQKTSVGSPRLSTSPRMGGEMMPPTLKPTETKAKL